MKLITSIILILIASITNASELDKLKSQSASIYDIGLISMEMYFSDPIDIGINLYKEGFVSGNETAGSFNSRVDIHYGYSAMGKDNIILQINNPFNVNFNNQMQGISPKGAERLANTYINAIRERLGVKISDNGEIDDKSWTRLGAWFSHRGADFEDRRWAAEVIGKQIIFKTIISDVSQVDILFCEAVGMTGKTICKEFGE